MIKKIIFILAGILISHHGVGQAENVFRGIQGYGEITNFHRVEGYQIQPPPIWQKCGLHHRPCGIYGQLPPSYYRNKGFRPQAPAILQDHR